MEGHDNTDVNLERKRMPTPARSEKEFPFGLVLILAMVLTINGYTLSNLFPYVGMMVKYLLGLPSINEAGFYAGYIASSFTFGRFLSAYVWGAAADRLGRKFVILLGLSSIVVCSISFGLSSSFAMAICSRLLLGLTNGIMSAVRTTTQEVCDSEHVVMGMGYVSGSRGVGLVIGTSMGGLLALPTVSFPTVFSSTGVFATYPFLLPNLFGASCALVMIPVVYFLLPETAPRLQRANQPTSPSSATSPDLKGVSAGSGPFPRSKARGSYQPLKDVDVEGEQQLHQSIGDQQENGGVPAAITTYGTGEIGEAGSSCSPVDNMTKFQSVMERKDGVQRNGRTRLLKEDCGHTVNGTTDGGHTINGTTDGNERVTNSPATGADDDVFDESTSYTYIPSTESISSGGGNASDEEDINVPLFGKNGLFAAPNAVCILFMAAILQVVNIGFEEVYPLWALSTVEAGGLGWSTTRIGQVFGVSGIGLALMPFLVLPTILKTVGIVAWHRFGGLLGVVTLIAVPYARMLSWNEESLFAVSCLNVFLVLTSFSSIMLPLAVASTVIIPPHQRGTFGGLFMTFESFGRFTGPATFSNLFAWSISPAVNNWMDCRFTFFLSAAIMAIISLLAWRTFALVEEKTTSPRRARKSGEGDELLGASHVSVAGDVANAEHNCSCPA